MASLPAGPKQNVKFALFTLSGNQCAFDGCEAPMYTEQTILGEICHIHAQSPGGPRYKHDLSLEQLHAIENLILLCQAHHKVVDDHPELYPAERLFEMKAQHEQRASTVTSSEILHRLVDALVPSVPSNWWERPGAPIFRTSLASSRPDAEQWTFEVTVEQLDGSDIGALRSRYRHGSTEYPIEALNPRRRREWRLPPISLRPTGERLELEFKFWWDGAERTLIHRWDPESAFQSATVEVLRS